MNLLSSQSKFEILNTESSKWVSVYEMIPENSRDFYLSPQYAKLCAKYFFPNDTILCAMQTNAKSILMFPFVLRSIRRLSDREDVPNLFDARGLFGRSLLIGTDSDQITQEDFLRNFRDYCNTHNIVSLFARLHPELNINLRNQDVLEVKILGSEIAIDTSQSQAILLASANHSVRKNLRKALVQNIAFSSSVELHDIDEIYAIYMGTLERNAANEFYFFPKELFIELLLMSAKNVRFFKVTLDSQILSFEIVLVGGDFSHSFLGGTHLDFLKSQANTILKIGIFEELRKSGVRKFFLGGGSTIDDSIFSYKRTFAPKGIVDSYVISSVLNQNRYNELLDFFLQSKIPIAMDRLQFYET